MPTSSRTIATECLYSWTNGDLDTVRSLVSDDLTAIGPLGTTQGADRYVDDLRALRASVDSAVTRKVLVDGNDVCIIYDLVTSSGASIPTAGWYHVRNGLVDSVRSFFDPRALV